MRIFKDNPFGAYYTLSSPSGKQFKAISSSVSKHVAINNDVNLVLDPTSICLLYELSIKYGLVYKRKFIVSSFISAILIGLISDIRNSPHSKMSLSIRHDRVYPHIYPDDFNEKLASHYEEILIWINNNCEVIEVPERFNFIMNFSEEQKNSAYLQLIMENKLLSDRDNFILLTDDVIYYRSLRSSPSKVIGSQLYLYEFHSENRMQIIEFLLEHNYIGVPISASLLKEELIKFVSGKENCFSTCLENLKYSWNPDINLIYEAVKFIKSLYLELFIDNLMRQRIVSLVFANLLVGLPQTNLNLLSDLTNQEFKLLPIQQLEVLDILTTVMENR